MASVRPVYTPDSLEQARASVRAFSDLCMSSIPAPSALAISQACEVLDTLGTKPSKVMVDVSGGVCIEYRGAESEFVVYCDDEGSIVVSVDSERFDELACAAQVADYAVPATAA